MRTLYFLALEGRPLKTQELLSTRIFVYIYISAWSWREIQMQHSTTYDIKG